MPNWCYNKLTVRVDSRTKEAKEQFVKFVEKLQIELDESGAKIVKNLLNKFIPMPEELRITSGSTTTNGLAILASRNNGDHRKIDEIHKYPWAQHCETREDVINLLIETNRANIAEAEQSLKNIEKYGVADWYEWCRINWGTKWDMADTYVKKQTKYRIILIGDTAWGPPLPVIEKMAEEFPNLIFEIHFIDEGGGFDDEETYYKADEEEFKNCIEELMKLEKKEE